MLQYPPQQHLILWAETLHSAPKAMLSSGCARCLLHTADRHRKAFCNRQRETRILNGETTVALFNCLDRFQGVIEAMRGQVGLELDQAQAKYLASIREQVHKRMSHVEHGNSWSYSAIWKL